MRWFLRLFSAYRELESAVVNERLAAAAAIARADRLEQRLEAKIAEHDEAMKKTVDAFSRVATGRNVFSLASDSLASFPLPHIPVPGKRFARDFVQEKTQQFMAGRAQQSTTTQAAEKSLEELMAEVEKAG